VELILVPAARLILRWHGGTTSDNRRLAAMCSQER
jgi:hypothetical protein